MLTVEQALAAVRAASVALPARSVRLLDALGLALAEPIVADIDLPPFDKALMDGYAVRSADFPEEPGEIRLRVVEEITAGMVPSRSLNAGEAVAIMTGAPLPHNADAVVMVERTSREGDFVVFHDESPRPGRNVLRRGRETRAGDVVLAVGERLTAARLGLLASVGRVEVTAIPRPTVAIVPTGNELVEPDQRPGPGQIRNSNATMLASLATQAGGIPRISAIIPDDSSELEARLREALDADVVLITGGVSAGTLDLVPETLERLGVERVFHKVRVKPGKPIWFGVARRRDDRRGPLVFGLPGNPVSGMVGFLLFVKPALERLQGRETADATIEATLADRFELTGDRPTYHPARRVVGSVSTIRPLAWAGSADLRAVASGDGFAVFPAGDRTFEQGEIVRFLPFE